MCVFSGQARELIRGSSELKQATATPATEALALHEEGIMTDIVGAKNVVIHSGGLQLVDTAAIAPDIINVSNPMTGSTLSEDFAQRIDDLFELAS